MDLISRSEAKRSLPWLTQLADSVEAENVWVMETELSRLLIVSLLSLLPHPHQVRGLLVGQCVSETCPHGKQRTSFARIVKPMPFTNAKSIQFSF